MSRRKTRRKARSRYRFSRFVVRFRYEVLARVGTRVVPGTHLVLLLAIAPLWDGVFASLLGSGQITIASTDGVGQAIAFGIIGFSGGGVVAAALKLEGTRRQNLVSIAYVYAVIGVGMALTLALLRLVEFRVVPEVRIFCALVLLSLSLVMLGVQITVVIQPMTMLLLVGPSLLLVIWLAPHLSSTEDGMALDLVPAAMASLLTLVVGMAFTTLAVFCRSTLDRWLDGAWLNRAGAIAVAVIALAQFGVPMPPGTSLIAFVAVTAIGPVLRLRFVQRLRCLARAYRMKRLRSHLETEVAS